MKEAAVALSRHKKRVIQAAIPCDRHCVRRLKFCKRIQDSWIFKIDSTDWIVRAHGRSVRLPVCPACIPCGLKSWLVQRIVRGVDSHTASMRTLYLLALSESDSTRMQTQLPCRHPIPYWESSGGQSHLSREP